LSKKSLHFRGEKSIRDSDVLEPVKFSNKFVVGLFMSILRKFIKKKYKGYSTVSFDSSISSSESNRLLS